MWATSGCERWNDISDDSCIFTGFTIWTLGWRIVCVMAEQWIKNVHVVFFFKSQSEE